MEITTQFSIKYRPHTWEDIVGQDQVVKALRKRIIEENYGKAIILEGMYGCGKTTIAEIYSAAIMSHDKNGNPNWNDPQCKTVLDETFTGDVIRLDGGMFSGKSDMVELLQDLNNRPLYSKNRVIILEECDQLSGASVNALLKTLEDPHPWNHFILLSMLDKKGIPSAIKSRCQTYKINPVEIMPMMMGLKSILEKEELWGNEKIPQSFFLEGLKTISEASLGSMRSAVQYLEQCLTNEAWTSEAISNLLQVMDETAIWKLLDALLAKTKDEEILRKLIWLKTGDEVDHFYQYAIMMLGEALLYKETKVACADGNEDRLKKLAASPNLESLFYCLTLNPQMSKPFMRSSDLVGCIAGYYQGLNFNPNNKTTPVFISGPRLTDKLDNVEGIRTLNSLELAYRQTLPEEKPLIDPETGGFIRVSPNGSKHIIVGNKETGDKLLEKIQPKTVNGVRVRTVKQEELPF